MTYSDVRAAHDALVASLEDCAAGLGDNDRFAVIADLGEITSPPAVALSPPSLREFTGFGPRVATWTVAMVVASGDRVVDDLYRLLPLVVEALDGTADAIVTRADAGVYRPGATELPAYFVSVEVAL